MVNNKPALGLPGNPVSAMVVFDLLVRPTLYHLCGCAEPPNPPTVNAQLAQDIASTAGREDYVPVRLKAKGDHQIAEPVFGKMVEAGQKNRKKASKFIDSGDIIR